MNRPLSTAFGGLLLLLGLSACAATPPESTSASPAPDRNAAGTCDAGRIAWAIGQVADDALIERARVESGSTTVRVLRPGMLVTNDVDAGRLNLRIDNGRKVLSTICG
jgi:hypothetical protein